MEREAARKQIMRMGQMNRFPKEIPESVGELVDALMTAPTEEIAKAIVSDYMASATADTLCPMPSAIRADVESRLDPKRPDPDCLKCHGIGQIIVERNGTTGASGCDCWARRPAPVYKRQPGNDELQEQIKLLAARKAV